VRGILYTGRICGIPITLNAEIGQSLTVEASVFIPELAAGEHWYHPNFLGLSGFLDRIRFAVDPEHLPAETSDTPCTIGLSAVTLVRSGVPVNKGVTTLKSV